MDSWLRYPTSPLIVSGYGLHIDWESFWCFGFQLRGQLKLQSTIFDRWCVRLESMFCKYVLYNYTHEPGSPIYMASSPNTRHPDRKSYPPYPGPAIELPLAPGDVGLRILAYTCVYLETISVLEKTYREISTIPREYHATWFISTMTRLLRATYRPLELFCSTHLLLTLETRITHWTIVSGCNYMHTRRYYGWSLIRCKHVCICICLTSQAFFQPAHIKQANPLLTIIPFSPSCHNSLHYINIIIV